MAYDDDGSPAAPKTQTPDQQSATGQPGGGGSSVGLLDALQQGGGGAPSNAAILSLLQGPSFSQRMGQAAAGGTAFMRGIPNPANAIIEQQQKQQLNLATMMERMSEQERLAKQWGINQQRLQLGEDRRHQHEVFAETETLRKTAEEQDKFRLELNDKALANAKTPEARLIAAQQRAPLMEKFTKIPTPQSVIQDWTIAPEDSKDRREAIAQAFVAAQDPKTGQYDPEKLQLAARQYNLPPDVVTYYSGLAQNDAWLEANKIPTRAVLKDRQNQYLIREQEAKDSVLPFEQRKDPQWYARMDAMAAKTYPGLNWADLDRAQRGRIYDMAKKQDQIEELVKFQQQASITAAKQMQVFGAQQDILQQKKNQMTLAESNHVLTNKAGEQPDPSWTRPEALRRGFFEITPKELAETQSSAMALKQLEVIRDSVEALKQAKLTADTPGIPGYLSDQARITASRYMSPKDRALLVNVDALKAELINILRKTGDNARAAQLLIPAIQTLSPMSGAEAIRGVMGNLEKALRAAGAHSRTPDVFNNVPTVFPQKAGVLQTDEDGWGPGARR